MRKNKPSSIELFFLNTLLRIGIVGICIVLITDGLINPNDKLSLLVDSIFLITFIIGYLLRNKFVVFSVLLIVIVVLISMIYQSLLVPINKTSTLSILLIAGFIVSIMLKGKIMWFMHGLIYISIGAIFFIQYLNPSLSLSNTLADVISVSVAYSILYFVLTYATFVLKTRYDKKDKDLSELYTELQLRNNEIIAQNEELVQIQDNLNELNTNLENKVIERTTKIQLQNEVLIKYSYAMAHHLRGPVARLLGLANVYAIDTDIKKNADFFVLKMKEEAQNIDLEIKKINEELNSSTEE